MGLKLRYNLFRSTTDAVFAEYTSCYGQRGLNAEINFYREHNGWVVVDLDGGWEWECRRDVQLSVSRALRCAGFLILAYDGDYWGYEFFDRGEPVDHFVPQATEATRGFPDHDCTGNPVLVAERLPFLRPGLSWLPEDAGRRNRTS